MLCTYNNQNLYLCYERHEFTTKGYKIAKGQGTKKFIQGQGNLQEFQIEATNFRNGFHS